MNVTWKPNPRLTRPIALAFFFLCLIAGLPGAEWRVQVVDPGGGGKHSGLAVDTTGNIHVVYWNELLQEIKYAFWDRRLNKWFLMKIADRSSGYCSIALDSHQRPHVAFLDGQLKYARWDGTTWKIEAMNVGARLIEYYTSIAIDPADHPMMTYYEVLSNTSPDYILRLRSVRYTGNLWELSTVDRTMGSGKFNSMTIGKNGIPQVAYANVKDETFSLRYAWRNGATWENKVLEGISGPQPMFSIKLALDKDDNPHIAYTDAAKVYVKYASLHAGKWQIQVVDRLSAAAFPDRNGIALDDQGKPYISYYDSGPGVLKVAHMEGDKWFSEVVDTGFSGFTSSIQVADGEIIVTYFDTGSNSLKCARRSLLLTKGASVDAPQTSLHRGAQ